MSLYTIIQSSKSLPIDTQMDLIYDHIDLLIQTGDWTTLNRELDALIINIKDINLDCLVGVACATLPGEHELVSRSYFMAKCKELYPEEYLWHGL